MTTQIQIHCFQAKSVGRTEDRAYVVQRTYVVEHHDKRHFLGLTELFRRQAMHLYGCQLMHSQLLTLDSQLLTLDT